ncbi:MAG: hypothetical protein WKF34_14175 [Pyrinomonadaceae bacterium]
MKESLLALFVVPMIAAQFVHGQNVEPTIARGISAIRSTVASINRDVSKLSNTTSDINDIALEGAEVRYFRSMNQRNKAMGWFYGETFRATGEFYYDHNKLIFAFLKYRRYDTHIGAHPPPKIVSTEEQRFYFAADGRLIRLLVGKKELKSGGAKYSEFKDQVTRLSSKIR